ncbi:TonB C-terminal domain-containing protein [Undibacterium sp. TC4M20W]|uniref:TonB C-terminal domain-containing protein n=1 Tax=Undibacterium sp. TC4M20W TaxID=3413052 RepID=UPI003BF1C615
MKSQNKKTKPAKQVKQEQPPGGQEQAAKAGEVTPTTTATPAIPAKGIAVASTTNSKARTKATSSGSAQPGAGKTEKLIFGVAITTSLVLHALALLVHFVMPKTVENKSREPDLEVILVNSKHSKRPVVAEALAQADLDGGGAHDSGRSKSPLPDMNRIENGDALQTSTKKIAELEEQQKQLIDQTKLKDIFRQEKQERKNTDDKPKPNTGSDNAETSKALARGPAEIAQTIEDQNKRPKKISITPSTQKREDSLYYTQVRQRIEDTGTLNFPQKDGKKLYGQMYVAIPISPDGSLYERNGGPQVITTSGDKDLDAAALRIVRRSAPFKKYPKNAIPGDGNVYFEMIARFKFTREQHLEAELREARE